MDETYDPIWRRVHVPEQFQRLVCPMAEEIHKTIFGKPNLAGAANYWSMVMSLRPYLFQVRFCIIYYLNNPLYLQCGAAIFQICPESPIFRLPAFMNDDVKNWMKTEFPQNLILLKSQAGDPIEIERIQNDILRQAFNNVSTLLSKQTLQIKILTEKLDRRTSVLSPTKSFSTETYQRSYNISNRTSPFLLRHFVCSTLFQSPRVRSLSLYLLVPSTACPQHPLEITFQKIPASTFLKMMDSHAHLSTSHQKSLQLHVQRLR